MQSHNLLIQIPDFLFQHRRIFVRGFNFVSSVGEIDLQESGLGHGGITLGSKSGAANAVRIPLTTSGSAQQPAVVWTGSRWLVFFSDERTGARRLWMARLSASGARLGSDELVSCGAAASFPHAAFDGTRVALTWISTVGTQPQAFVKVFVP